MRLRLLLDPVLPAIDATGRPFGAGASHRLPGTHLSTVLRYLEVVLGKKQEYEDDPADPMGNWARVGFIWERVMAGAFADSLLADLGRDRSCITRPENFEFDGIALSPDAVDDVNGVLEEYKFTWRSIGKLLAGGVPPSETWTVQWLWQEHWYWMCQMAAYCRALGLTQSRLVAMFCNGDWKFGRSRYGRPVAVVVDIAWDEAELAANWNMVKANAAAAVTWAAERQKEGKR